MAYIGATKLGGPWAMTHIGPFINPAQTIHYINNKLNTNCSEQFIF